jgi:hypothetical protein
MEYRYSPTQNNGQITQQKECPAVGVDRCREHFDGLKLKKPGGKVNQTTRSSTISSYPSK